MKAIQRSLFDRREEAVDPLDLFPSPAGSALRFAFDAMGWAEEAIEAAQNEYPSRAGLLGEAFPALHVRYDLFRGRGHEHVVRAHMDELLGRIAEEGRDADLAPGTSTEGVVAVAEAALSAPLKHHAYVATVTLFVDAFGREAAVEMFGEEEVRRAKEDRDQYKVAGFIEKVREQTRDESRQEEWQDKLSARRGK